MKYVPLAILLLTAPLLSQGAVRVEDRRAIGQEDTSDPRYLGPPLRVPVVTLEQLRLRKAAGLSATEAEAVPRWTAIQLRLRRANGISPLPTTRESSGSGRASSTPPDGVEWTALVAPPRIGMPGYEVYQAYKAEFAALKASAQALLKEESAASWTAELAPMRQGAGDSPSDFVDVPKVRDTEDGGDVDFTAEEQRMRRVAGSGRVEPAGVSYTAEEQRMRRVAGSGRVEPAGVSYTATQTRPRQAAGLSNTQSSAETLNRLRTARLGRDAAKEAIHNVADAIAVQVRPDKVQIQALANALKAIGFEEFADELDRTEPRLIIDYWFPRLWTRVLDHQLTRSIEGLDATRGERELFSDVRELLRERAALTLDRETHQRLEELLDAAEVAGTDSRAFQELQVEWVQVRMRRAIGLARQDRERTGIVSPTVRQRLIQLHGELGALRATDS